MRVTVVTSITGDYVELHEPVAQILPDGVTLEWVCVTDRERVSNTWRIAPLPRFESRISQRLQSKAARCEPFDWCARDTEVAIWMDAAGEVVSPHFVADVLAALGSSEFAAWAHPDRDCVYEELEATLALPKYADKVEQLRAFGAYLRQEPALPEHWGLWCGTVVAYRKCDATLDYGRALWLACLNGAENDQLAMPMLFNEIGVRPALLPQSVWANDWIIWHRPEFTR